MATKTKRSIIEREWQAHGLDCAVLKITGMGHRCGYVRVPEDHPWFGLDYDDEVPAPAPLPEDATAGDYGMAGMIGVLTGSDEFAQRVEGQVRVHGGVTYAGEGPGDLTGKWWFGFDCAHSGDRSSWEPDGIPWDTEEVVAETERMAAQIAEAPDKQKGGEDGC